jgi:hypothetical protein
MTTVNYSFYALDFDLQVRLVMMVKYNIFKTLRPRNYIIQSPLMYGLTYTRCIYFTT